MTVDELRRKFPLGATVYYRDIPSATVCGYNVCLPEPEVLIVWWQVEKRYGANKIGQFSVRGRGFSVRPFELDVHEPHASGVGSHCSRTITVYFDPKDSFETERVWRDVTNHRWAIDSRNLHRVLR